MKRHWIQGLVFLVAMVASAVDVARAQELDRPTVKGAVSIQLPKGWVVGNSGLISAQVPQADKDPTGTFQATLKIDQTAGTKLDGAAQQANVARTFGGYQAVDKPTPYTTASGLQGLTFSGTYKVALTSLRIRHYMFLANGQIYTITFVCLNSRWAAYSGAVEASAATFNVRR
jgi:hypothetical protein